MDGEEWMGMRLFEDDDIKRRFINEDEGVETDRQGDVCWNEKAVEGYLRKVKKFKEELIVLVHMTTGAPARSTELVSIQGQNGKDARSHRGVFVDNGLVAFVTAYHKGFSASQSMKIIHRFMPSEVGELVVYLLWLIEPFVRVLQGAVKGQRNFGSWLWEPTPEEEWPEADGEEEEENEEEGEEEEEEEEVAGQRKPDAEPTNSDGFWDTNRARRAMQRETADRIGVAIGIGGWRQGYPAIHREFATNGEIREMLDKIYEDGKPKDKRQDEQASIAAIRSKQAGHSPQM
ncbi:hypothetical protein LTR66_008410 [Elasticomyces elasticus]|nr:hypothetical protein LTR66_008410 [Elasticomyces elasticus]KAK5007252.1 hypothetical protein LTR28_005512 [Elasticomyces elasticus]